ncbi:IS66 family insertion sequence element accessory protein TnpB [Shinella sp. 838]|uniref:IS66 family insertion sequence element accessory protein TnpB n=1 Tax=Shinella sp. 838 TaxID=3038164 RepID=UPI003FA74241
MIVAGQRLPILIATRPVDFRCGHQALALMVQTELKLDPHSGVTVIFRSKRGDRLKSLSRPANVRCVHSRRSVPARSAVCVCVFRVKRGLPKPVRQGFSPSWRTDNSRVTPFSVSDAVCQAL